MKLLDRMRIVLQADGVELEPGQDELRFHSRSHNFSLTMRALEGNGVLLLISHIPIFAPMYRRAEICEALTRANYGLWMGAFEMDLNDGEIRFRIALPVEDAEPTDSQLRRLVRFSLGVIGEYGQALIDVACTDTEPAMAVERAEASWQEMSRNAASA